MPHKPPTHRTVGPPKSHEDIERERKAAYDKTRGSASSRGYTSRWTKASKTYLRSHPLCEPCEKRGIIHAAEVVDHIVPHKGDQALFWDKTNWQAMAKTCHDAKTASEDSRFAKRF